ncbi:MAG: putative phytoene dehydrogenase [Bacteroidetes bacterium]|nr:putative phytoene dehydrogenase [Bacteroidota bacterium]
MGKKVVILGGGVAGMSAAHELCERGFQVSVYELKETQGGKARSMDVPDSAKGGRKPLPGEHGFRFFPRFYKHLPDTMARIPFPGNPKGVFNNLVEATRGEMARYGKKPIVLVTRFPKNPADIEAIIREIFGGSDTGLTDDDLGFFAGRLWVLVSSCYERRLTEYEKISWWDFIGAEGRSAAYQQLLAIGLTRTLVAAKAQEASARTGGDILLQLIFDMTTPGISADRLLNAPTDNAWLDPWLAYLEEKGVNYQLNASVEEIKCDGHIITGAIIKQDGKKTEVKGDYFISALPIEVMSKFITPEIIKADPSLQTLPLLAPSVSWMNGIQFYLKKNISIVEGHTIYIDTPWALTSVSQRQFWPSVRFDDLGDGTVEGVLSVDISDWYTPGTLFTKLFTGKYKSASECTRKEIQEEVWHQLKKSLNFETEILGDDMLHSWFLDTDIVIPDADRPHPTVNLEPLLVNKANTWKLRPEAVTAIPNLLLASDYVRTYTDLATMEGANEAARRAVNAILIKSGSKEKPCGLWNLHEPELLAPWRYHDQKRFVKGLPWDGGAYGIWGYVSRFITWLLRMLKKFLDLFRKKPNA